MSSWRPIHWHEGMFLRPHHFQADRRWLETVAQHQFSLCRPFWWGVVQLSVSTDALKILTLRLNECLIRMKDGAWICVPDNAVVEPLNFEAALSSSPDGALDLYFGIPQYDSAGVNSISVTNPQESVGNPRFDSGPEFVRDENTGENRQRLLLRRYRARLFQAGDDMTGFDVIRLGAVRRSDSPGAVPEFEPQSVGPHMTVQSSPALGRLCTSLLDQIDAKGDVLAKEALELRMSFGEGTSANTEHLLKLHAINTIRTRLRAVFDSPALHPFEAYVELASTSGHLSVFDDTALRPEPVAKYDHDRPAAALLSLKKRIEYLLDVIGGGKDFEFARFERRRTAEGVDGLAVDLKPRWLTEQWDLYIALESNEYESSDDLLDYIYGTFDMKLASPERAPRLFTQAVRGLRLERRTVKPGTLPRRSGLHYFWIHRTGEAGQRNYWAECEDEHGIFLTTREGQRVEIEKFRPTIYAAPRRG